MSDDDVRWVAPDTGLTSDEVRARIQSALAAQHAWVKSVSRQARFVGTVQDRRFILRTTSPTKEFALEGAIEPTETGTRVVVSIAALRRRPIFQALAVILVVLGGCIGAWFEAQSDPDWPETAIGGTAASLGLVFGWLSKADVTSGEAAGERRY